MVVLYDPNSSSAFYQNYYTLQSGDGISVFKGATVQRGRGIGSFFSRMLRGAMPLLKTGAKTVGKQLITSSANMAKDLLNGSDLKSSAVKNFSEGGSELLSGLANVFQKPKPTNKKRKKAHHKNSARNSSNTNKRRRLDHRRNIFQ